MSAIRNQIKGTEVKTLKALEKELLNGDYRDYYSGRPLKAEEVKAMLKEAHVHFRAWFKKTSVNKKPEAKAIEKWTIDHVCDWVRFPASNFHEAITVFDVARKSRPELYFRLVSYTR